jgi:hypothetical protein
MKIEIIFTLDTEGDDLKMINGVLTHISNMFKPKEKKDNVDDNKRSD